MSSVSSVIETLRSTQEEPREDWHITDRGSAQWAMQKLYALRREESDRRREAQVLREPLQAQLDLIASWEKQEVNALETRAQFFEGELIRWLARERETDPDLKSVKLAHGTVASRKKPDGIVIENESQFLEVAKASGRAEFIRIKEEIDKARLKEAVLKDGEIIEGVQRVEGERVYEVKLAGEVPADGQ